MKRYCFDNSGFSNPLHTMPEEIYESLWLKLSEFVIKGHVATTPELYDEMKLIPGGFGDCLKENRAAIVLEVDDENWDGVAYIEEYKNLCEKHHDFLSEYKHKGARNTICLKDMTIVAMAKTLKLPVVSMESSALGSPVNKRIPDICSEESVIHLYFNDFLTAENIKL